MRPSTQADKDESLTAGYKLLKFSYVPDDWALSLGGAKSVMGAVGIRDPWGRELCRRI